jgi:RHS repeat-associated protein
LVAEVVSENSNTAISGRVYETVIGEEYTIQFDVDIAGLNSNNVILLHHSKYDEFGSFVNTAGYPTPLTLSNGSYSIDVIAESELMAVNFIIGGSATTVGSTFILDNFKITGTQQTRTFNCAGDNYLAINYRFGFNGQEEDPEWLDGAVSFKYRVQDKRTGRFLSVDPLYNKYPWYSPYQVAGNTPIYARELEGLEPDKNPNKVEITDVAAANFSFKTSGGHGIFEYLKNEILSTITIIPIDIKQYPNNGNYIIDTDLDIANKFNVMVQGNSAVTLPNLNLNDKLWVNFVVGSFKTGQGFDHYVFPENGFVSNRIKDSYIVGDALEQWKNGNSAALEAKDFSSLKDMDWEEFSFNKYLPRDIWNSETINTLQGMIGGAMIKITSDQEVVRVQVLNIMSVSSGDLIGDALGWMPLINKTISLVRHPSFIIDGQEVNPPPTRWGNVAQTYSFTIPLSKF